MMRGLKVPFRASPSGSAQTIEGPSVVSQNIALAIIPSTNRNPWRQHLAPDEELVFDIADEKNIGGLIARHIRDTFSVFERRGYAKLLPGSRGISIKVQNEEVFVYVRYVNLEKDKVETLPIRLR